MNLRHFIIIIVYFEISFSVLYLFSPFRSFLPLRDAGGGEHPDVHPQQACGRRDRPGDRSDWYVCDFFCFFLLLFFCINYSCSRTFVRLMTHYEDFFSLETLFLFTFWLFLSSPTAKLKADPYDGADHGASGANSAVITQLTTFVHASGDYLLKEWQGLLPRLIST